MICDFCGSPEICWEYFAHDFDGPEIKSKACTIAFDMIENWMACDPCYKLIQAGQWDGVAERCVNAAVPADSGYRPEALRLAQDLYSSFRAASFGVKPWSEADG